MNNKKILTVTFCVLFCVSLALNGVLVFVITKNSQVYQQNQKIVKILYFRNMFEEKVWLSGKPVDFDGRLSLDNAVKNLNDAEILNQWEKFSNSQTQADATVQAKTLLELLIQKTSK